jgi:RimJ/RimL family protein N-acetyltransferase
MTSSSTPASAKVHDVKLRPLRMSDRQAVRRWMADPAVINFTVVVPGPEYGPVEPYDAASADQYLEVLVKDPDRRSFAIVVDGAHVGNVGLKGIDLLARTSECFIEIGDTAQRRRGTGLAAMTLLLDVAFGELGLTEVRLGVFEFNAAAIAMYRRVGFVDNGLHGSHYLRGRYHAINRMCIDATTWAARRAC